MKLIVGIISIYTSLLVKGWALTKLWYWFAVNSAFHCQMIDYRTALGISVILQLATYTYDASISRNENKDEAFWNGVIASHLIPVVCVFFGWIINLIF